MRLLKLALANVRNYAQLEFAPAPGLNVFFGANAQGKSNLLEAVAVLGTGKSFRTSKDADLILAGCAQATIAGEAALKAGIVRLSCSVGATPHGTRKLYRINGQSVRYAKFLGSVKVVTFSPADLQLAAGPPKGRRAFLNVALAQDEPAYYRELARYQKALQQKSALLRGGDVDLELLAVYNGTLVTSGTALMVARAAFAAAVADAARATHAAWTNAREALAIRYIPNVAFDAPTPEAIGTALHDRLQDVRAAELARKSALAGPHRDDVAIDLDGMSLAAYGSQGQQRTAVLALKAGEYAIMRKRSGEAPLLLLDDVLSELDDERAAAFLGQVGSYEQAFMTATHAPRALPAATVYEIRDAHLRQVA